MGAKKQQTFAKLQRERRVKEKRQLKQEKKAARKLELAAADGDPMLIDSQDERDPDTPATAGPSQPE
jgi:hypothetical protein